MGSDARKAEPGVRSVQSNDGSTAVRLARRTEAPHGRIQGRVAEEPEQARAEAKTTKTPSLQYSLAILPANPVEPSYVLHSAL